MTGHATNESSSPAQGLVSLTDLTSHGVARRRFGRFDASSSVALPQESSPPVLAEFYAVARSLVWFLGLTYSWDGTG